MKPLGTFRFFLALCVLFGHTFVIVWKLLPQWLSTSGALSAQLGVLMFFTVSGYIICFTIDKHYASRPFAFLANRAVRIYPVHIATFVMACLILIPFRATEYTGDIPQISRVGFRLPQYLMGLTIFPGWYLSPNSAMWSVFVELQFYLFAGLAIFFRQRNAIYWTAGTLVSLCVLLQFNPVPWLIDFRFGAYGPFFAFFVVGGAAHYLRSRWAWPAFALGLAASLYYILALAVRPDIPKIPMAVLYLAALAVFFWLITAKAQASTLDTHLGGLSYPLYACHVPIVAFMAHGRHGLYDWLIVAGTCLLVALLLYLTIERPLMATRRTVREKSTAPRHGVVAAY